MQNETQSATVQTFVEPEPVPAEQAFAEVARAIATIERHRQHLPDAFYHRFGDAVTMWIGGTTWEAEPALIEQIMPILLAETARKGV